MCLLLFFLSACARGGVLPLSAQSEFVLDTVCTVNLFEGGSRSVYAALFSRIREIDRMMSAYQAGSDTDLVNRNAGLAPVKVHAEFLDVLEKALRYAEQSGGALDPTVGPLVKLWGIGTEEERVPDPEALARALALVDYRDLVIDRRNGTAFLARTGQALDLGAVAKGYAADEAARIVREAGLSRSVIDLGGNIMTTGSPNGAPEKKAWRIGVQDPLEARGTYLGILRIPGGSVVTSGVYERFFEQSGKRYHHILSPKDGYPVDNGLLSVTIAADSSADADALSTAVFCLGYEKGSALIRALPGVAAVFVFEDRSVRQEGTLSGGGFTLESADYRLR